jgi:hypothetical protein
MTTGFFADPGTARLPHLRGIPRQISLGPAIVLSQGRRAGRTVDCLYGQTAASAPMCELVRRGGDAGARRCARAVAADRSSARFVALVADLFGHETDFAGPCGGGRLSKRRPASSMLCAVHIWHGGNANVVGCWRGSTTIGPIAAHRTRDRRRKQVLARRGPHAGARATCARLADPSRSSGVESAAAFRWRWSLYAQFITPCRSGHP